MILVVSLDVEADNQWEHGRPLTTHNVRHWEPFQELCELHGVLPTYLITSEIVEDGLARDLLSNWHARGAAEIGAHLHPWSTPPFAETAGLRYNDGLHAFPSQVPDDLLQEKIAHLSAQISEAFARAPTAFRAGRFGLDGRLARHLADAGFIVDSSVTPLSSWRDTRGMGTGGPDYSAFSIEPFRVKGTGDPGLIELPVTVMQTYGVFDRFPGLLGPYRWLPVRAVRRTLLSSWLQAQPMWLTPHPNYRPKDLALVWRRAEEAGARVAVMMFHSSELMPGGSPFRPTSQSVREMHECLGSFFAHVRRQGGTFAGLTEAALDVANADLRVRAL